MALKPTEPIRTQADFESAVERCQGRLRLTRNNKASRARSGQEALERPRTVSEAAEELGLSVHTIRAWVADRRIGHLRLGRAIRIPAAEVRRVIEESTVPAVKE